LPGGKGPSREIDQPKRIPIELEIWACALWGHTTTLILSRDGGLYYLGLAPVPSRTGSVTTLQQLANAATRVVPRTNAPFPLPGSHSTETPVRIGELPPSVISALKAGVLLGQEEQETDPR
jgi:hypothetical protein